MTSSPEVLLPAYKSNARRRPACPGRLGRNPSNPSHFGVVSQGTGYVVTKLKSTRSVKVLLDGGAGANELIPNRVVMLLGIIVIDVQTQALRGQAAARGQQPELRHDMVGLR
jgi:hypothetical protein